MRGKLSDQDLTNYALNDGIEPRERLYAESLLAVSEECRHDVGAMIGMAQLLEQAFKRETDRAPIQLTPGQRARLMQPRLRPVATAFLQRACAAMALGACSASILLHAPFALRGTLVRKTAGISTNASKLISPAAVRSAVSAEDDFARFVDLRTLVDDSAEWLHANEPLPPLAIPDTPPSPPDRAGSNSLP